MYTFFQGLQHIVESLPHVGTELNVGCVLQQRYQKGSSSAGALNSEPKYTYTLKQVLGPQGLARSILSVYSAGFYKD